jgi:hypothetical protein
MMLLFAVKQAEKYYLKNAIARRCAVQGSCNGKVLHCNMAFYFAEVFGLQKERFFKHCQASGTTLHVNITLSKKRIKNGRMNLSHSPVL